MKVVGRGHARMSRGKGGELILRGAKCNRYIGEMRTTLAVGNPRDRNVSVKVDYTRAPSLFARVSP